MTIAYVGVGANLGDAVGAVRAAIQSLARIPRTTLLRSSALYRTAPVGSRDQPDFVNAVVALDTSLAAAELLHALQELERRAGRARPFPNAPRTLDLDLLLYGSESIASPLLTVPHPRMHERAFVLAPLTEIAPETAIPGKGRAAAWLAQAAGQRVERMAS